MQSDPDRSIHISALKRTHATVLQALEAANGAHARVASLTEVALALTPAEARLLAESFVKPLPLAVRSILTLLEARGLVFTVCGKKGATSRHFYGSVRTLDPTYAEAPSEDSRRQRVLALVREAVGVCQRPVRACDVTGYALRYGDAGDISTKLLVRALQSLTQTGELCVVGRARGDGRGLNLSLPADMDAAQFAVQRAPTWIEEVASAFNVIWSERLKDTEIAGTLPRPISTRDVRARLAVAPLPHANLQDVRLVANAMLQLAASSAPTIRQIKRPGLDTTMWVPAGVADGDINFHSYASDTERMAEAVRRAELRLNRPVTKKDVGEEVEHDETLKPTGRAGVARLLNETAREEIADVNGGRRTRVHRRVYYAGSAAGTAYYCSATTGGDSVAAAESFVHLQQLSYRWEALHSHKELALLTKCKLSAVAIGRAQLLMAEAEDVRTQAEFLLTGDLLNVEAQSQADKTKRMAADIVAEAREFLTLYPAHSFQITLKVDQGVLHLTPEELVTLVRPVYPFLSEGTVPANHRIVTLIDKSIRRVANTQFISRFHKDPQRATEFFFDRTDALLYTALQWGNRKARIHALTARNELGALRDTRFVLPNLTATDFVARLTAVACIAFLPTTPAGTEALQRVAATDAEPNVREAARWALITCTLPLAGLAAHLQGESYV